MPFVILWVALISFQIGELPSLSVDPQLNPLPPEVLAFPEFSENYRQKIVSGDYEIWSEDKLARWASAQGLSITPDHEGAGLKYHRTAVIASPGLTFTLTRPVTEKGSEFANGWKLNLDIAAIKGRDGRELRSSSTQYNNLLECDIYIDRVLYYKLRQGAKITAISPIQIYIPHIRSAEGKLTVELKLANHPRNFLFLYDAYLSR